VLSKVSCVISDAGYSLIAGLRVARIGGFGLLTSWYALRSQRGDPKRFAARPQLMFFLCLSQPRCAISDITVEHQSVPEQPGGELTIIIS